MTPADVSLLFRSRILFVSGKGGTGKTTLAVALGHLAAQQGRRTVVVEVDNQRPALTPYFGSEPGYAPVEIAPRLSIANIAWVEALEDWVAGLVSMRRIVRLIMANKVVQVFLNVTPGARDLVVLWRVVELAERFDTVVVDLPASGNAVAMLSVPLTAERLFLAGPIRECANRILADFARPDTRALLVAIPEEMVVNETVETARRIRTEIRGMSLPMLVLNRASAPTLTDAERTAIAALGERPFDGPAAELVEAGRWEAELEAATSDALARLEAATGLPVVTVPLLARSEGMARLVSQVGGALARASSGRVDWRGVGA